MFRLSLRRISSKQFVPSCPKPDYDTGCTFCQVPEFPPSKQIDYERNLLGTASIPWKHMLVLSHGQSNFDTMPAKIEMIPDSLSFHITGLRRKLLSANHPVLVSNILLSKHAKFLQQFKLNEKNEQLVMLYPDHKIIKFQTEDFEDFIKTYLVPKDTEFAPAYNPFSQLPKTEVASPDHRIDTSKFVEYDIDKRLILICGHTQRDVRCGKLAPMLQIEFEKVLEKENIEADVGLISHIGGHAYAGNVIYFSNEKNAEPVWYGRVFPELVQGVVKETIVKGNIIRDLFRGVET